MRHFFTLFATLIAMYSFSQATFRIGIAGIDNVELYNVVQLDDGSYIGVGFIETDNSTFCIVKLNAQGQVLAIKRVRGNDATYSRKGASVVKTADGNIIVSGTLSNQIALFKFDLNLNIIWNKTYLTTAFQGFSQGLVQTSDGGYMIAGYTEDGGVNNSVGCIIKIASDGSVSWGKRYFGMTSYIDDIVSTKDGNYVFLAHSNYFSTDTTHIVKIDSSGNIIWSEYVNDTLHSLNPISMASTSDGGIVVCGDLSNSRLILLKVNNSGNLLWAKTESDTSNNYSSLKGVIEDKDGGYVASGENVTKDDVNGTFTHKPYLLKVSNNSTLQWAKTYPFTNSGSEGWFQSLTQTNDGGYAIAGHAYDPNIFDDESFYTGLFGTLCKINSDLVACGNVESFGTLTDLTVTTVSTNLLVSDEPTTAVDENPIVTSTADIIDFCLLLPTQLISFNATLQNQTVILQWKTANEVNTASFIVERSSTSTNFQPLQQVKSAGNSNNIKTYAITDAQPLLGTSYYRLKQVDKDGSFTYSSIASVTVSNNGMIIISPNPVHHDINLILQSITSSKATIQVTDITGKIVSTQQNYITTGSNNITVPAALLAKGIYILRVIQNDKTQSVKFVKE